MPAAKVFAYAVACLEREAVELGRQLELFLTPAEAFGGRDEIRKHVQRTIHGLFGMEERAVLDPREQQAVAEIERELADLYPWYADSERLNQVWRTYGKLGRQMLPL
ncbi:MAG TPA: hypothetical protein VGN42_22000, partial [Pirellulales bacterium]|nr:hypothetical protein [Pirellulales bacterium]